MHDPGINIDDWEKLLKKEFGAIYKKIPGKYGRQLQPLANYPKFIKYQSQTIYHYDIFGSEKKPAAVYQDTSIPTTAELEKRIRETGRQLFFPELHLRIFGIQNNTLFAKREE